MNVSSRAVDVAHDPLQFANSVWNAFEGDDVRWLNLVPSLVNFALAEIRNDGTAIHAATAFTVWFEGGFCTIP